MGGSSGRKQPFEDSQDVYLLIDGQPYSLGEALLQKRPRDYNRPLAKVG